MTFITYNNNGLKNKLLQHHYQDIYTGILGVFYICKCITTESSNFKIEVGTVFAEFFSETEALCKKDSSVGDKFR